ncbi:MULTISPECIES: glycosyltransferase family 4 protein [Candidatus Nitrosocaldus]|uniref:glycosyltransferase family 4 protein n=1 Tax=Candidatus Nitrosocaldus TaxID=498374 RepID=UPI0013156C8C|nr:MULTISPECIES: glycosyltransferase family 4 protein [Candidatus Nitrosocaldus]
MNDTNAAYTALKDIVGSECFDIIHIIYPGILPNKVNSIIKSRIIIKYSYLLPSSRLRSLVTSFIYKREYIKNNSGNSMLRFAFTTEYLANTYSFDKNVLIIPPAIDTNIFVKKNITKEQILNALNSSKYKIGIENVINSKYVILYLGWLVEDRFPYKIVLKALKRFLKHYDAYMLIIGRETKKYKEEENAKAIINYARDLGVSNNVAVVLKELDEQSKVDLINAADLFLFPLMRERLNPPVIDPPMVVLEAMALEKPVITSKIQSLPYIIKDGHNGFLLEKIDEEQLYIKMKQALEHNNIVGKEASRFIKEKYSIHNIIDVLRDVYQ